MTNKKVLCSRCLFNTPATDRNEERFIPEDKHIARYGAVIVAPFKECICELTLECQMKGTSCDCNGENVENVKKRIWNHYKKLQKYCYKHTYSKDSGEVRFYLKACALCISSEDVEHFWYYQNGWTEIENKSI